MSRLSSHPHERRVSAAEGKVVSAEADEHGVTAGGSSENLDVRTRHKAHVKQTQTKPLRAVARPHPEDDPRLSRRKRSERQCFGRFWAGCTIVLPYPASRVRSFSLSRPQNPHDFPPVPARQAYRKFSFPARSALSVSLDFSGGILYHDNNMNRASRLCAEGRLHMATVH